MMDRRTILRAGASIGAIAAAPGVHGARGVQAAHGVRGARDANGFQGIYGRSPASRSVEPVPVRYVRLAPSLFTDAFEANRRYLFALDPERLLHNFYRSAGLPAPRPGYGGWEAMGIAGHSLGHWLSACALVVADGRNPALAARLDHALAEMARIQAAHGDGYCGGTIVERDGRTIDGKIVFEELRRGDIHSNGFDLNDGWVPLYSWHKVYAGLLDAHRLAHNPRALPIALALAGYLADVLEPLDDDQMQQVLRTEHGGLNEAYADTYALTGNPRWLHIAEKIRHRAVLDPLTAGRDQLAGLHANTQIPKVIGLARLHEVTGNPVHAIAPRVFHDRVTHHHSYVIGGNSEREHFGEPDQLAGRITEATCEACNSYNMLKLTRHLYSWQPDAAWFDTYERIQLNHILAHQRPDTGRFVYFMPLAAGARRVFSSAEDSFWCCVGSGMESHAKHADSIWWSDPRTVYLNLFIPSHLDWPERGLAITLDTAMPFEGGATLTVRRAPPGSETIAIRIPGWAGRPTFTLNGRPATPILRNGYAMFPRRWRVGDRVTVTLPMALRAEPVPGDPGAETGAGSGLVAFTYGPLVMAADLGPADMPYDGIGPALMVDGDATTALSHGSGGAVPSHDSNGAVPSHGPGGAVPARVAGGFVSSRAAQAGRFRATGAMGEALTFKPFFAQYDRRVAVYFPTFTPARWAAVRGDYIRAQGEARALAARTVDIVHLGEMQPERDHGFSAARSEVVNWNGRSARRLRPGQSMRLTLARRPGPAVLRVLVAAADATRAMAVVVNGVPCVRAPMPDAEGAYAAILYTVPSVGAATAASASASAHVTVTATGVDAVIYEMRMMTAPPNARADAPSGAVA